MRWGSARIFGVMLLVWVGACDSSGRDGSMGTDDGADSSADNDQATGQGGAGASDTDGTSGSSGGDTDSTGSGGATGGTGGGTATGGSATGGSATGGTGTGGTGTGGSSGEGLTPESGCLSTECDATSGVCTATIAGVFRDFQESHVDFENSCDGALTTGLVQPSLSGQGIPVLEADDTGCISTQESFAEWYTDQPNNVTLDAEVVLYSEDGITFTNRWGPNGERWTMLDSETYVSGDVDACSPDCFPCSSDPDWGCTGDFVEYDGTPVFFPIDGDPDAFQDQRYEATIPPEYGSNYETEEQLLGEASQHNFLFTSEMRFALTYDNGRSGTLRVQGDDDVWVFVNGTLAIDLGGKHEPEEGQVTIGPSSETEYALQDGQPVEIAIFHAERERSGSTMLIELVNLIDEGKTCGQ